MEINATFGGEFGPAKVSFELPFYVDLNKEKIYIKSESYMKFRNDVFLLMTGTPFYDDMEEEMYGYYIQLDLYDTLYTASIPTEDKKELHKQYKENLPVFFAELPEEQFVETENGVKFTVDSKELFKSIIPIISEIHELEELSEEYIEQGIKELEELIAFDDTVIDSELEKGKVVKDKITIPLTIKESGEEFTFKMTIANEYQKLNEPVEFSFDIDEEKVISMDEFTEMENNYYVDYPLEDYYGEEEYYYTDETVF